MIPEKGDTVSFEGRQLEDYEQEAWAEYHAVIEKYHKTDRVKMYDRVSIHEAFPEIKEAFDHACAMATYYRLENA